MTKLFVPKQLEGMPLEVILYDPESRSPVSFAILELRSAARSETLKADGRGSLQLVLTDVLLRENPEILASKNGIALAVKVRIFGALKPGGPKPALVDISNRSMLLSESLVVLYQKHDSVLAESVLNVLKEQRAYIKMHLPLPVIPWGVVLVDSPPPFLLSQSSLRYAGVDYHLFPYWIGDWRTEVFTDNFYRWAKNCLFAAVELPDEETAVWLFNGLPGYWLGRYLAEQKFNPFRPSGPLFYSDSTWIWLESLFRSRRGKPLNLLRWRPTRTEDWVLASAFFRALWVMIGERYGEDVIANYVGAIGETRTPTLELYLTDLFNLTGKDVEKAVSAFHPDSAWRYLSQLRRDADQ